MDTGPQEGSCGVWHQGIGGKSCVLQGQASMDLTCSGTSCRRAIIMGSWAFGGQVGTLNSVMFHISILCSFCSVAGHIVLLGDHCSPEGGTVFGWTVCVKWQPYDSKDPRFPSSTFHCNEIISSDPQMHRCADLLQGQSALHLCCQTEPNILYSYSTSSSHSATTLRSTWVHALCFGHFGRPCKCIPIQYDRPWGIMGWRVRVKSFHRQYHLDY